eukprot:g45217.t1
MSLKKTKKQEEAGAQSDDQGSPTSQGGQICPKLLKASMDCQKRAQEEFLLASFRSTPNASVTTANKDHLIACYKEIERYKKCKRETWLQVKRAEARQAGYDS